MKYSHNTCDIWPCVTKKVGGKFAFESKIDYIKGAQECVLLGIAIQWSTYNKGM